MTRELLFCCFRFCFCCVHCLWFVLSVSLFVVLLFCFCLCCSVLFSSWACSAAPPLVFDRIPWTAPWPKPANCGASLISDRPGHQTNWTNPCPNKSCELRACRRSRPAGQLLSKRYQRSQGVGSLHKLRRHAEPCTAHTRQGRTTYPRVFLCPPRTRRQSSKPRRRRLLLAPSGPGPGPEPQTVDLLRRPRTCN